MSATIINIIIQLVAGILGGWRCSAIRCRRKDAERAARAALAIQRALAELNRNQAGAYGAHRARLRSGGSRLAGEIYGDVAERRRSSAGGRCKTPWCPTHTLLADGKSLSR
jgi:hypothetical protein